MSTKWDNKIPEALLAANIDFCAISTTGVNVYGDRASINKITDALNSQAQLSKTIMDLRHWQQEAGKLHAKIKSLEDHIHSLQTVIDSMKQVLRGV